MCLLRYSSLAALSSAISPCRAFTRSRIADKFTGRDYLMRTIRSAAPPRSRSAPIVNLRARACGCHLGVSSFDSEMARKGGSPWVIHRPRRPRSNCRCEDWVWMSGPARNQRVAEKWCERNKDWYYVPEWLLNKWKMTVDPHLSNDVKSIAA